MHAFTVHQAETRLSELLAQARRGEEVVVVVGREPVVRLVAFEPAEPRHTGP